MATKIGRGTCDQVSPLAAYVLCGNFPLIVKKILLYLPAKNLNTAARVCKQWSQLAEEIKKGRTALSWFMVSIEDNEEEEGRIYLAEKIKTYLETLWCEPETLLTFITTDLYEEQLILPNNSTRAQFRRASKCSRAELRDFMQNLLPPRCKLLGVASHGAVGSMWNCSHSTEVEGKRALTIMSLPQLAGVELYKFTMDISSETNWHTSIDELNSQDVDISALSGIPKEKQVKAVLLFCDEPFCPPEVGYSVMRQYRDAVIAGGYVDNLVLPRSNSEEDPDSDPAILCVAFCGDNLKVASVVIRESVRSAEDVENQIRQLKDCRFSEQKSFAFMFACVGRGESLYRRQNVESDAFRRVFPQTPLFGFFGNGEIGYTSLPVPSGTDHKHSHVAENKTSKHPVLPKLYHAYTTIICLFSVD